MIVSIASGKGGTGKTTVSSSLASVWDRPLAAVDLDVEEPNLHLFLNPRIEREETITLEVPEVIADRCTNCGACSDICQFKAIVSMGAITMTFPEMCHGCGGCFAVCPEDALKRGARELGVLAEGRCLDNTIFMQGTLRVGEAMSPPLMRSVKQRLRRILDAAGPDAMDAVVDAPPGVSCPAMNAVMDSDAVLLVTEPTPFGFHDFALAWEAFAPLGRPMGAVINRAGIGDDAVSRFCAEKGLPILAEIPYDRAIAEGYAKGRIIADLSPELAAAFKALRDATKNLAKEAAHA